MGYGADDDSWAAGEEKPDPDGMYELLVGIPPVECGPLADPVGATVPVGWATADELVPKGWLDEGS